MSPVNPDAKRELYWNGWSGLDDFSLDSGDGLRPSIISYHRYVLTCSLFWSPNGMKRAFKQTPFPAASSRQVNGMSQPPWLLAMNGNYMRLNADPELQMWIPKCHGEFAMVNLSWSRTWLPDDIFLHISHICLHMTCHKHRHLRSAIPSGKQPDNYGTSTCYQWINPLFRLGHFPCLC